MLKDNCYTVNLFSAEGFVVLFLAIRGYSKFHGVCYCLQLLCCSNGMGTTETIQYILEQLSQTRKVNHLHK